MSYCLSAFDVSWTIDTGFTILCLPYFWKKMLNPPFMEMLISNTTDAFLPNSYDLIRNSSTAMELALRNQECWDPIHIPTQLEMASLDVPTGSELWAAYTTYLM
jgi:hypothetical protein